MLTSLTAPLAQGVIMLGTPIHKPSFLPVDLSWVTSGNHVTEASAPLRTWTLSSPSHLAMECPPKADSHMNMTAELQEILSHAILDTSSQMLGGSTLKRLTSPALGASPPAKAELSSKPVATSSQASPWVTMPDITEPIIQTPKVVCTPTTPPTKTPGAGMGALPEEVIILQEEMNNTMGCLLMTRASIDTHHRKQVSDFETAIHQNEAEATEAIWEVKAHCGAAIREVESHLATTTREAEAHCATTITEVESHCATDIREQSPTVQIMPTSSNNLIATTCNA